MFPGNNVSKTIASKNNNMQLAISVLEYISLQYNHILQFF